MTLEQQVCSLELAKRLKELGVKQESLFCWSKCCLKEVWDIESYDWHNSYTGQWTNGHQLENQETYSAFTVAELGEMLPFQVLNHTKWFEVRLPNPDGMKEHSKSGGYICTSHVVDGFPERLFWNSWQDTEADARAKMLIYLLENKLIITL